MPKPDGTLATFYGITEAQALQMQQDMDAEAATFWAYPDEKWQFNFEAQWLRERGYEAAAEKALAACK